MTERATASFASAVALWIVAVVAILFFLRAAKTLLIPIALAVLISYALAPVVSWLERHRVPRLAGAGLVLLLILGASGGGAYALRDDARELAATLPKAVQRARQAVLSRLGSDNEAIQQAAKALGTDAQASGTERSPDRTQTHQDRRRALLFNELWAPCFPWPGI